MRFIKTIGLSVLGLGIVVAGFVYDVLFAGIPYQDPTPELQARWDFHRSVAAQFYRAGGIMLVLGLVVAPLIWTRTRKACQQRGSAQPSPAAGSESADL